MTLTLAVVPDTQIMAMKHPALFRGIGSWIVDNADRHHIDAVLHVGDVVNNGAADLEQFAVARSVRDAVVAAGLPMFVAAGNHDDDDLLNKPVRSLTQFAAEIGAGRSTAAPWFGGAFAGSGPDDGASNYFGIIGPPDRPLLVCVLEFAPRAEAVAWAKSVLDGHAETDAVLLTHAFLDVDGNRTRPGTSFHPDDFAATRGGHDGEMLWAALHGCGNLRAVFSGHQVPANVSYRVEAAADGHPVLASFQNWQMGADGGGGRIRLVDWDRESGRVELRVVNTATGHFEHEPGYDASVSLAAGSADVGLSWPGEVAATSQV